MKKEKKIQQLESLADRIKFANVIRQKLEKLGFSEPYTHEPMIKLNEILSEYVKTGTYIKTEISFPEAKRIIQVFFSPQKTVESYINMTPMK